MTCIGHSEASSPIARKFPQKPSLPTQQFLRMGMGAGFTPRRFPKELAYPQEPLISKQAFSPIL